ncbi:MAG: hypothetical protein LBV43_12320, partial [Prevotella sp.]|nr:hypothetical protein [Prevotella sp.]
MTLEEVTDSYKSLIDREKDKLSKVKNAIFQIGTVRLIIVIAAIVLCYIFWGKTSILVAVILIAIIAFLFFMKYHNKLFIKRRYCELLIENAENELKAIDYDFSAFDGAPEKADANHSFSLDLDIFGNRSFFQSINRTVTSYGKDKLADALLYPFTRKEDIYSHQEAVKELAANPRLQNHFRATGQMSESKDLDIHNFSQEFLKTKLLSKSVWRYFAYIAPTVFIISIILSILNILPATVIGICWTVF